MDFKKMRESLKQSIDQAFAPLDEMMAELDAEVKKIDAEMERSGAEKTVTVEETKEHGVVTKVVTRTVYRSRKAGA